MMSRPHRYISALVGIALLSVVVAITMVSTVTGVLGSSVARHHASSSHRTVQRHKHTLKVVHVKIVSDPNTIGAYKPKRIVVHRGEHIVFKNVSDAIHTVTADNHHAFNSNNIAIGHSWTLVAKKVGTFKYRCLYHPLMVGVIVVKR